MLTIKVPLAPSHVDAINSIPVEFDTDKKVLDAWRLYSSHLNMPARAAQPAPDGEANRWLERKFDLLIDLVYEIGQGLGYTQINKASLRDNVYIPKGHQDVEAEWHQIRKAWLEVLNGTRPLPMTMVGTVQVEEPLKLAPEILPVVALPQAAHPALPPIEPTHDED